MVMFGGKPSLREKCPYSELFWSVFSRIGASVFSPNVGKYGPKQLGIDTFNAVSYFFIYVANSCILPCPLKQQCANQMKHFLLVYFER